MYYLLKMKDIILITSVIRPPDKPLSYTNIRSIFTPNERFEQTKKTIESVKQKIPNYIIFLIECSQLTEEEYTYFKTNVDIFINIMDTNNQNIIDCIYSHSKSLGEGSQTIFALQYLLNNNIEYNNFFKLSGRYWLSDNFNYDNFNNKDIVIKYINDNSNNCFTALYKLPSKEIVYSFLNFLVSNINAMCMCIGYEVLLAKFFNKYTYTSINPIGLAGYVSVSNDFYNG